MIGGSGRERKARRRQDEDAIQTGCRCITCLDSSNKSINFSPPPLFLATASPDRPSARPPQVQAHTRSGIFSASAYLQDGACNSLSARPALLGLFYFNPDEKDEEMIKSEGVGGGGVEGGRVCVCESSRATFVSLYCGTFSLYLSIYFSLVKYIK